MRHFFWIVATALLVTGCVQSRTRTARTAKDTNRYLLMTATPLEETTESGRQQVLLETAVIEMDRVVEVNSLLLRDEAGSGVDGRWRTQQKLNEVLATARDARAEFLSLPSLVTVVGEEATIQVAEEDGSRAGRVSHELRVSTLKDDAVLRCNVAYDGRDTNRRHSLHYDGLRLPVGSTLVLHVP